MVGLRTNRDRSSPVAPTRGMAITCVGERMRTGKRWFDTQSEASQPLPTFPGSGRARAYWRSAIRPGPRWSEIAGKPPRWGPRAGGVFPAREIPTPCKTRLHRGIPNAFRSPRVTRRDSFDPYDGGAIAGSSPEASCRKGRAFPGCAHILIFRRSSRRRL